MTGDAGVPVSLGRLSFEEARRSPCLSCATSPCCRYLPVYHFQVANYVELDYALYLLNFRHITLGLSAGGEWAVYFRRPCRYLGLDDGLCSLHGSPEQPSICRHYNPYSCWYRKVLAGNAHEEFVLVDRARLQWIADRLAFDEQRDLVAAPEWSEIVSAFAAMPVEDVEHEPEAPAANGWRPVELAPASITASPPAPRRYADPAVTDPCRGCGAHCCTTLVFPTALPANAAQLDYLRFCLGFPGVELGLADEGWSLIVHTTCRHLDAGRCGLFGQPERPVRCSHYDALRCDYKPRFGGSGLDSGGFLRAPLERFGALAQAFAFDDNGQPLGVPSFAELQAALAS